MLSKKTGWHLSFKEKPLEDSGATLTKSLQEQKRNRTSTSPQDASRLTEENVRTIAQLQEGLRRQRTFVERLADGIGSFVGSMSFAVLHIIWFTAWSVWNLGVVPGLPPFDRFPFMLLSLIVSCEAVVLSTFVLIKQNRMSRMSEERAHLNLQIDILAEQEITKMLQMIQLISQRLGVPEASNDRKAAALSEETGVEMLAQKVHDQIPKE